MKPKHRVHLTDEPCLDRCIADRATLEGEVAAWRAERNALGYGPTRVAP